jgi:hypothetical protein
MANGGFLSKEEWAKYEAEFSTIDIPIKEFAKAHNLEYEKNCHEWPNRFLRWNSDNIRCSIQITFNTEDKDLIKGMYSAAVGASYSTGNNKSISKSYISIKNVPFIEIKSNIDKILKDCYEKAESWEEKDLDIVTDLSPRKEDIKKEKVFKKMLKALGLEK